MYRIETWEDLQSTGFFDYLDTDRVLVIEWSENIRYALPETRKTVRIVYGEAPDERRIEMVEAE